MKTLATYSSYSGASYYRRNYINFNKKYVPNLNNKTVIIKKISDSEWEVVNTNPNKPLWKTK